MRNIIVLLSLVLTLENAFSQQSSDSIASKFAGGLTNDTNKFNQHINKAWTYKIQDSSLLYFNEALRLSKKMKWHMGEAIVLGSIGAHSFEYQNNYTRALSHMLKSLEISQHYNDTSQIAYVLSFLSAIYNAIDDVNNALLYGRLGLAFGKASRDETLLWLSSYNLGLAYAGLNIKDSALLAFQECYQVANVSSDHRDFKMSFAMQGLGKAHLLLANEQIALAYLHKSVAFAKQQDNNFLESNIYITLSEAHEQTSNYDSAVIYSVKSLNAALKVPYLKNIFLNYKQLANLYEEINTDSAVKYYKLATATSDSLFSTKTRLELSNLTDGEEDRRRESAEKEALEAKERQNNLQFALIAIGLLVFLLLFLVLSRSIVANAGLIRFLGIVALLLVFEFINLFIHPYIGAATHHSPLWMFMIMVVIAAILVPLHHNLERWITHQLVEKNKRIRLEAAKKTIADLEG
jgi:hypothetical protein